MGHRNSHLRIMPFVLAVLCASHALADDAGSTQNKSELQEIIVTAQKRAENLQSVPIAITATSGEVLSDRNITDITGLSQVVPNVYVDTTAGETRIAIRGITFNNTIATGAEPRVASYLDGVYIAHTGNLGGQFFDLDRVETLRGPQGTLFGRNAIAGVANFITQNPTDKLEGYLDLDRGNYNEFTTAGAISGPLSNTLSGRVAFETIDHDGYFHDVTTHQDIDSAKQRSVRAKLKFQPNDDFRLILSADFMHELDSSGIYFIRSLFPSTPQNPNLVTLFGGVLPTSPAFQTASTAPVTYRQYEGVSADAEWKLGNGYNLISVSGYRQGKEHEDYDADQSSAQLLDPVSFGLRAHQFSEELRLQKDFDRGNWLVGAYFFRELYLSGTTVPLSTALFGGPPPYALLAYGSIYGSNQSTRAEALFAQGTFDFTDHWSVTAGMRYNEDHKTQYNNFIAGDFATVFSPSLFCDNPCNMQHAPPGTMFNSSEATWRNASPLLTLKYEINTDQSLYATVSRGFKGGGYYGGQQATPFAPEKLTDFEGGFKGDFLNRVLRVNVAGFYYDYRDIQVTLTNQSLSGEITNAGRAKLYGGEIEIEVIPLENLRLNLAASDQKSKFTQYDTEDPSRPQLGVLDLAGNRLPNAPKYTMNYGAEYTLPSPIGAFTLRGEGFSVSNIFFDQFNQPRNGEGAYSLFNAYLNWKEAKERFNASLYIRNITNELRATGGAAATGTQGYPVQGSLIPPKTFGIKIGIKF